MGSRCSKQQEPDRHYNDKPDLDKLLKVLKGIDVKWFDIGRALNIDPHVLRSFEYVKHGGVRRNEKRLKKVLKYWKLNGDPNTITWRTVITAVSGPLVSSYSTVKALEKLIKPDIKILHISCAVPDRKDLMKILKDDINNLTELGRRLDKTTATEDVSKLIAYLYNAKRDFTWGDIISALEKPSPLYQLKFEGCLYEWLCYPFKWECCCDKCKFGYVKLSEVVKNYLSQKDVYIKYESRLPVYSKELYEALTTEGHVKVCISKVVVHGPPKCKNEMPLIIESVHRNCKSANPLEHASQYWKDCVKRPHNTPPASNTCLTCTCPCCTSDNLPIWSRDNTPLPALAVDGIAPSTSTFYMKGEDNPVGVYMVQVVNTGGLLDIAPALLRYTPVNVLMYDFRERLDDRQAKPYGIEEECSTENQISNIEFLKSSFRSLASINPRSQPHNIHVKVSNKKPHFVVVGTSHKSHNDIKKSIEESEKFFSESLAIDQYCSSDDIVKSEHGKIFPVHVINDDSTTSGASQLIRGPEEEKMAKKIHNTVINCCIKADIPIHWLEFKFKLDMLSDTHGGIISRKKCEDLVANQTQSNPEVTTQLGSALKLFHDLTVLSYFPNILPDVVFLNPQLLIDTLANLTAEIKKEKVSAKCGVFKRSTLELCHNKDFPSEIFTVENFLHLMQKLYIIAPLSEKDYYFLPSSLPSVLIDRERDQFFGKNVPLILTWDMKPIPSCLFFALVIELLQSSETHIELIQPSKCTSMSQQQYRNVICLICKNIGGRIFLVHNMKWFEVHYDGPEKKCSKIRSVVLDSIAKVVNVFHFVTSISGMPEECFHCPPKPDKATTQSSTQEEEPHAREKHLCSLNEDKSMLTCQDHGVINSISDCECWFNTEVKNITQEPDHFALLKLLTDIASYWHEIGLALSINDDPLRTLTYQSLSDVVKLREVLKIWRDNPKPTCPHTWDTIIKVVGGSILGNKSKAEEIRRYITRLELAEPEHTNMQEKRQEMTEM